MFYVVSQWENIYETKPSRNGGFDGKTMETHAKKSMKQMGFSGKSTVAFFLGKSSNAGEFSSLSRLTLEGTLFESSKISSFGFPLRAGEKVF